MVLNSVMLDSLPAREGMPGSCDPAREGMSDPVFLPRRGCQILWSCQGRDCQILWLFCQGGDVESHGPDQEGMSDPVVMPGRGCQILWSGQQTREAMFRKLFSSCPSLRSICSALCWQDLETPDGPTPCQDAGVLAQRKVQDPWFPGLDSGQWPMNHTLSQDQCW